MNISKPLLLFHLSVTNNFTAHQTTLYKKICEAVHQNRIQVIYAFVFCDYIQNCTFQTIKIINIITNMQHN